MSENNIPHHPQRIVIAVFRDHERARVAVEELIKENFPMDQLSLLGRGESSGDDPLGIYYSGPGERIKTWGSHGAFWGGLWGLFASAAGMFILPGIGSIFAIGPIVEGLAAAAASATLGAGAMAGAAAISQLAVALHRLGVPEGRLKYYHDEIGAGHYVVLLRCSNEAETLSWKSRLDRHGANEVEDFPYLA